MDGPQPRVHHPAISTTVAAGFGLDGDSIDDALAEAPHFDAGLREFRNPLGAVHAGAPAADSGKAGHRERGGSAAVELQRQYLVIDDVVVAPPHAASVRTVGDGLQLGFAAVVEGQPAYRPALAIGIGVELDRRIGAVGFDVAVHAALAAAGRGVLGPKVVERPERADRPARSVHQIREVVDVVAALGQEHERRAPLVSPFAAHETVGLVPPQNLFEMIHGYHGADAAGAHYLLEDPERAPVAQRVAYRRDRRRVGGCRRDALALFQRRRHGLLHQQVVAGGQGGERWLGVVAVHRRDHHRVQRQGCGKQVAPVAVAVALLDVVGVGEVFAVVVARLGDRHDVSPPRTAGDEVAERSAPAAGADDGYAYCSHRRRIVSVSLGGNAVAARWRQAASARAERDLLAL